MANDDTSFASQNCPSPALQGEPWDGVGVNGLTMPHAMAAAPPTISEISFVMPAWRVLL